MQDTHESYVNMTCKQWTTLQQPKNGVGWLITADTVPLLLLHFETLYQFATGPPLNKAAMKSKSGLCCNTNNELSKVLEGLLQGSGEGV